MDTIADFLTLLRNAATARHEKVDLPASNVRVGLAKILQDYGYIRSYKTARDGKQGVMRLYLKYDDRGRPVFTHLARLSKSSRRLYVNASQIPSIRSGYGVAILSTNKGIMSGETAKRENVGGELLCEIW